MYSLQEFALAAALGDLPGLERGLQGGADIDGLGEKWSGWTALHSAADAGQVPPTPTSSPHLPPTSSFSLLPPNLLPTKPSRRRR